jgi:hypothetical protein
MAANKVGQTLATAGQLTDIDSVAVVGATNIFRNPIGTVAFDESGNEWIYLLGVAATVQGSWVTFDSTTGQTALITNSATNSGPVAIANAAILALQYGWYMIKGNFTVAAIATTATTNGCLYTSATAGRASASAVAAQAIFGAFLSAASVANVGSAYITYPFTMQNSTL